MFVCLFVCLFVDRFVFFILIILKHPQEYTLRISWRSDLIWLRYLGSNKCPFVCLFVCLFIWFVFCFNHSGTPTESSTENFVKIRLDLAEILTIRKLDWKMIICLFVCLFAYRFVGFCFKHHGTPTGVYLKISWRSYMIWLIY